MIEDHMTAYVENPRDSTKKLLEYMNSAKQQDSNPIAFLYMNNLKRQLQKQFHLQQFKKTKISRN